MTEPPPELPGLEYERLLGSGGYSDVYLYRQELPRRQVAVKVLKDSGLGEAQRNQLTEEANAMAGLSDHPNIVPVFSASVSADGRPYIVMMYYSRPNLAVRAASERLGVAEVLRIGIQIASAVETAHRAGILHRDIKPANLLTSQYGTPGLADFGIASRVAALEDDEDTGVSVPWSAPEVLYSTAPASAASDVYSLAATLWHLLVGRSPFEHRGGDNSPFALMRRIRDQSPPATGRTDVPDSLDRLLRQAMAKDPRARIATAHDFARGLQAVEQERHLPRTEIVVITDAPEADTGESPAPEVHDPTVVRNTPLVHAAPASGPPAPEPSWPESASATIARPASYAAQSPAPPYVAPPSLPTHSDPPPTTARPKAYVAQHYAAPPGGVREGTVRSATATPVEEEKPPSSHRGLLGLIIAAVVLGACVVTGIAVFSGSGGPDKPVATVGNSPGPQNPVDPGVALPGIPTVTGTRAHGGNVVFTWKYDAALPADSYLWRKVGDPAVHRISTPKLTLPPAKGTVCVQVKVVRAASSEAQLVWSPKGCVR